ncbi:hypothetical protein ACFQZI_00165 [Mucilaginibacter lutimaris]|uniref:Uncharacterized protein n=1 Tax=Mucilaginibacter lutimaris TaxID=931629 RepID=A0ABW2ZCH7_9SPHI
MIIIPKQIVIIQQSHIHENLPGFEQESDVYDLQDLFFELESKEIGCLKQISKLVKGELQYGKK